jgi:hypothetical protein
VSLDEWPDYYSDHGRDEGRAEKVATAKTKTPKAKTKAEAPKPLGRFGPPLPAGTEAILRKSQVASALGCKVRWLNVLIAKGVYPKADGEWGGRSFWLVTTHNAYLRALAKKEAAGGGRVQAGE